MVSDHGYNSNMEEIAIARFKATCLAVMDRVGKTGKPVRVTRFGKPVADIVPPAPARKKGDWIGSMVGTGRILGDVVSPATDEGEWEALR